MEDAGHTCEFHLMLWRMLVTAGRCTSCCGGHWSQLWGSPHAVGDTGHSCGVHLMLWGTQLGHSCEVITMDVDRKLTAFMYCFCYSASSDSLRPPQVIEIACNNASVLNWY